MTPEKLAFIQLVASVGVDTALIVWKTLSSSATVDDAIVALEKSASKPWAQYKAGT